MTPPPPPPEDTVTQVAVVIARLDDVREDIAQLRDAVTTSSADKVSRGEWTQRNEHVDSRHHQLGREIAQLRTSGVELQARLEARRAPWWSVAAVVIALAGFAWSVFGSP